MIPLAASCTTASHRDYYLETFDNGPGGWYLQLQSVVARCQSRTVDQDTLPKGVITGHGWNEIEPGGSPDHRVR